MKMRYLPLILYSPVNFFKTMVKKPGRFFLAFGVFLTFLLLITLAQYLIFIKLLGALPANLSWAKNMQIFGFTFNLFVVAVAEIIFWILGTGILACVAILLDGEGEYRKLLELTGYSHLPLLLFSVFVFTFALVYRPQTDFSGYVKYKEGLTIEEKDKLVNDLRRDMLQEIGDWRFRILGALRQCFHLWTGICCAFALKFCFKISYFKSFTALFGLAVFYILLEIAKGNLIRY